MSNLQTLRDTLDHNMPENHKFNMNQWYHSICGSERCECCIGGLADFLRGEPDLGYGGTYEGVRKTARWLGITYEMADALFYPKRHIHIPYASYSDVTRAEAVEVLDFVIANPDDYDGLISLWSEIFDRKRGGKLMPNPENIALLKQTILDASFDLVQSYWCSQIPLLEERCFDAPNPEED